MTPTNQDCNEHRKTLWKAINTRVSSKEFYWVMGILVTVLIVLFSAVFTAIAKNSGKNSTSEVDIKGIQTDVQWIMQSVNRIEQKLE